MSVSLDEVGRVSIGMNIRKLPCQPISRTAPRPGEECKNLFWVVDRRRQILKAGVVDVSRAVVARIQAMRRVRTVTSLSSRRLRR